MPSATAIAVAILLLHSVFNSRALAQSADRDSAHCLIVRGCKKLDVGDLDGAMSDFTSAIDKDPLCAPAHYNRALVWDRKGDFDAAILDFSEAIKIEPNDAPSFACRGYARAAKGDLSGAIQDYNTALRLDPSEVKAYINRGFAR